MFRKSAVLAAGGYRHFSSFGGIITCG